MTELSHREVICVQVLIALAGMPPGMMGADGQPQRKSTIPEWLRADVARLASLTPACVFPHHST